MTLAEAVRTIKRLQPVFDELKEDEKALRSAKDTLGDHMVANQLDEYHGIALRVVKYSAWDDEKLRGHFREKAGDFRTKRPRRYFTVVGRRRRATR